MAVLQADVCPLLVLVWLFCDEFECWDECVDCKDGERERVFIKAAMVINGYRCSN